MDKTIFVITHTGQIHNSKFFETKELAVKNLKQIAKDRRHKMGVTVEEDSETKFSFRIGWEEHKVSFSIMEIKLHTS